MLFRSFLAPARTPDPVVERLHAEITRVITVPDVAAKLAELGAEWTPNSAREFADFMSLIKVSSADGLPPEYPKAWPAKIVVTTTNGRHERSVTHVPGDPARPFGEADLRKKFHKLVASVPEDQVDDMFTRALEALDEPSGLPRDIEMIDAAR